VSTFVGIDGAPGVPAPCEVNGPERATSCWYRIAGLISRDQKDLAVEIIEEEIRSAQHEVLLDAARLVLSGEAIDIVRRLRDQAEQTIRPKGPEMKKPPGRGRSKSPGGQG
jgi:hypothetical protein